MSETYCLTEKEYPFFSDGFYYQRTRGRTLMEKPHGHGFYEMLCILSGSCVQEINGKSFVCVPGSLVFLRLCDTHCFTSQTPDTDVAALSVDVKEMRKFLTAFSWDPEGETVPTVVLSPELRTQTERSCEGEPTSRYRSLLGIWLSALTECSNASDNAVPEFLLSVCAEMHKPENAQEGVPAFLRLSNFSHSQLCRLTNRWLHMTPLAYVNRIRLSLAYDKITFGTQDYETICEEVGFSSFSHFSALMKKTYGLSPAAIRKYARKFPRTV